MERSESELDRFWRAARSKNRELEQNEKPRIQKPSRTNQGRPLIVGTHFIFWGYWSPTISSDLHPGSLPPAGWDDGLGRLPLLVGHALSVSSTASWPWKLSRISMDKYGRTMRHRRTLLGHLKRPPREDAIHSHTGFTHTNAPGWIPSASFLDSSGRGTPRFGTA